MPKQPHNIQTHLPEVLDGNQVKDVLDRVAADEIFMSDANGNILYANDSACKALGYSIDELTSMNITDLNPALTQDSVREAFHNARNQGKQLIESRHTRKDGSSFPVEISYNILNVGGRDVSCSVVRNISERKQIELQTQQLRSAVDLATDAVYIFDKDANIVYANTSAEKQLGYTLEELYTMTIVDIDPSLSLNNERYQRMRRRWEDAVLGQQVIFDTTHKRKDGSVFPVEVSHCAVRLGDVDLGLSFVRDITERKETMRKMEELQFAIDNAFDAIYISDEEGRLTYVNDSACRMLDYDKDELLKMTLFDINPGLQQEQFQQLMNQVDGDGNVPTFETRHRKKDGSYITVEISSRITRLDGNISSCSFVRDVTERKQAQRKTEELQFAIDNAVDAVYLCDRDGNFYYVNESASQTLGYSREDLTHMTVFDVDPSLNLEEFQNLWDTVWRRHSATTFETVNRRQDGTEIPIEITTRITAFEGIEYACTFARDISERKAASRLMEEFRFAIDNANDPVYLYNRAGQITYANISACETTGYTYEELTGMSVWDLDADVTPELWEEIYPAVKEGKVKTMESRNRRKDGSIIPVEVTATNVTYGEYEFGCSFNHDISERKESERQMLFTQFAIDSAGDAIVFTNLDGDILYANQAACMTLGYTHDEILRIKIMDIDPSVPNIRRELGYWEDRADGSSRIFESVHHRKDGTTFPVEIQARILEYEGEFFSCSVARNITERKKAERQMLFTQFAIDGAGDSIVFSNAEGDIIYANLTACETLGYTQEELLKLKIKDIDPSVDEVRDEVDYWESHADGTSHTLESIHYRKDGSTFPVEIQARLIEFDSELFSCAVIRDISERVQAQKALRESEERFRVIADTSPVAMIISRTRDNAIIYANRQVQILFDRHAADVIGKTLPDLFDSADAREELLHLLKHDQQLLGHEVMLRKKDGSEICLSLSTRPITLQGEEVICSAMMDVTEAYELAQQLSYQASYDPLTGLVNRREFQSHLHRVIISAQQRQTDNALCFLDLDQFKVVNDTCGHIAGDELLRQLAQILKNNIRKQDTLARLGGDEFAILLENCNLQQAERVANSIRLAIQDFRFHWEDNTFSIGVSIGLVPVDSNSETTTDLLRRADTACYTAKDRGRNRIHVYHPDDEELAKRHGEMQWVSRINDALTENRLQLWSQRIVRLSEDPTEIGEHFEVLLRLQDREGNVISPDAFLPTAERYNIATRLDRWVITTIFNWYAQNPDKLETLSLCSINLSGQSLSDEELLKYITDYFESSTVKPGKFCFEITETAAIANLAHATDFIKRLKNLGLHFALDDFGSGLSSFAYLKTLPVDYLKIDGQFVKDVLEDPIDLAMVKSINDIGHVMGKKTIAEFVENSEIRTLMQEIGIDYAQGYGVAEPRVLIGTAAAKNIYKNA